MELEKARKIAEWYVEKLRPHCDKIMIAGSIRREKPNVGDIEICCIPKKFCLETKDLFGVITKAPPSPIKSFCDIINSLEAVKGNPAGKYTQRILPEGIKLDLFMADHNNWGLIVMIRTGSADYSKLMMVELIKRGYKSEDGLLIDTKTGEIINCPSERHFYELTGIRYLEPKLRSI